MANFTDSDHDPITIRLATAADGDALVRLAQLDSTVPPAPEAAGVLVAEVGGVVRAALPLDGGQAIADPFRPTSSLVDLLEARATELAPAGRAASRRGRLLGSLRPAHAGRA